ncbi:MAG: hypothetical protein AB7I50_00485 [Vicinamibacterales bacterium]
MLNTLRSMLRRGDGINRSSRKYPCCRVASNMRTGSTGRSDVSMEVCTCGRRHIRARVDPGRLGATGSPVNVVLTRAQRLFKRLSGV